MADITTNIAGFIRDENESRSSLMPTQSFLLPIFDFFLIQTFGTKERGGVGKWGVAWVCCHLKRQSPFLFSECYILMLPGLPLSRKAPLKGAGEEHEELITVWLIEFLPLDPCDSTPAAQVGRRFVVQM